MIVNKDKNKYSNRRNYQKKHKIPKVRGKI